MCNEYQLVNVAVKIELEKSPFTSSNEIIFSGKDHQWMKTQNVEGIFYMEGLGYYHLNSHKS